MKKKIRRSEQLPKYGTLLRSRLLDSIADDKLYQESVDKGLPLFTMKELDEIKERYKDGLTWEDIDKILSEKGIFFKKATFRKYIQDENLSDAIGYRNINKSRVAVFPSDTIAHISLIQYYYKIMDRRLADVILTVIKYHKVTYWETISNFLDEGIYAGIVNHIAYMNDDINDVIKEALASRPDDMNDILKMLEDINDEFGKSIAPKISSLEVLLQQKTMEFSETIKEGKKAFWKRKGEEFRRIVDALPPFPVTTKDGKENENE